jgi:putative phosphoesterase
MKYLIASDLHGSVDGYEKIKQVADRISPDKIVLLGDLCDGGGCGPVNSVLGKINYPIVAVEGNCDYRGELAGLELGDKGLSFTETIDGKRAFFSHGHLYNSSNIPSVLNEGDVLFYGHFHRPEIAKKKGVWCVCDGSVSRPSAFCRPAYCVLYDNIVTLYDAESDEIVVSANIDPSPIDEETDY